MADLSEHDQAVRALLLQTRPAAAALSDSMIDDLVQGNPPRLDSGGPALELNLWPLIEETIKWLPVVSAVVSIVSGSINIKKYLTPEEKPSVAEIADEVIKRLGYDRKAIEDAVKKALEP